MVLAVRRLQLAERCRWGRAEEPAARAAWAQVREPAPLAWGWPAVARVQAALPWRLFAASVPDAPLNRNAEAEFAPVGRAVGRAAVPAEQDVVSAALPASLPHGIAER